MATKNIPPAVRKQIAAGIKARWQVQFAKDTGQHNMATFSRMLRKSIYYQENADDAYNWIGPLRDATPKNSPFREPVSTAFEAVEAVMNGVATHPDPAVTRLARTFRKHLTSTAV
jgi:hypothetical protein